MKKQVVSTVVIFLCIASIIVSSNFLNYHNPALLQNVALLILGVVILIIGIRDTKNKKLGMGKVSVVVGIIIIITEIVSIMIKFKFLY